MQVSVTGEELITPGVVVVGGQGGTAAVSWLILTLGHNYSSLVSNNPGLGRYRTPWRAPGINKRGNITEKEKFLSQVLRRTREEEKEQQQQRG